MHKKLSILIMLLGGFLLASSQNFSIVWPGDANNNGIVNNHDLLYLGVAYGQTGPSSNSSGSTSWSSTVSQNWGSIMGNSMDICYADCNGDGIVDVNDTTAIKTNYLSTHDFPQPESPPNGVAGIDPPLALISGLDSVMEGTSVTLDLVLGSSSMPVNNFHGIAFTILYDPTLIQAGTMRALFDNTWLGSITSSDNLMIDFNDHSNGRIDIAITLTQTANVSGFGSLGSLSFVIEENLAGKGNSASAIFLDLEIVNIHVIGNNMIPIPISSNRTMLNIFDDPSTGIVNRIADNQYVSVFPNPASSLVKISSKEVFVEAIEILDATGKLIHYVLNRENHISDISVKDYTRGVYFFKIYTSEGIETKKIVVR